MKIRQRLSFYKNTTKIVRIFSINLPPKGVSISGWVSGFSTSVKMSRCSWKHLPSRGTSYFFFVKEKNFNLRNCWGKCSSRFSCQRGNFKRGIVSLHWKVWLLLKVFEEEFPSTGGCQWYQGKSYKKTILKVEFKVTSAYLIALYGFQCEGFYMYSQGGFGRNQCWIWTRENCCFGRWQNVLKQLLCRNKQRNFF